MRYQARDDEFEGFKTLLSSHFKGTTIYALITQWLQFQALHILIADVTTQP